MGTVCRVGLTKRGTLQEPAIHSASPHWRVYADWGGKTGLIAKEAGAVLQIDFRTDKREFMVALGLMKSYARMGRLRMQLLALPLRDGGKTIGSGGGDDSGQDSGNGSGRGGGNGRVSNAAGGVTGGARGAIEDREVDCRWEQQVSIYVVEYLRHSAVHHTPAPQDPHTGVGGNGGGSGDGKGTARNYRLVLTVLPDADRVESKVKLLDLLVF